MKINKINKNIVQSYPSFEGRKGAGMLEKDQIVIRHTSIVIDK